jgi:DNA-binding MarR family transcriptional regulator
MKDHDRIAAVQQFGRTYRAFMSAFEAQVGQPMPRWRILFALHEEAGQLSQKQLVERLRVDPGALTRQLKNLEALGWVQRSTDERDNRLTNVILTDKGRAVTRDSVPRRNAFLHATMAGLPEESLSALAQALSLMEACIATAAAEKPALPLAAEFGMDKGMQA